METAFPMLIGAAIGLYYGYRTGKKDDPWWWLLISFSVMAAGVFAAHLLFSAISR